MDFVQQQSNSRTSPETIRRSFIDKTKNYTKNDYEGIGKTI